MKKLSKAVFCLFALGVLISISNPSFAHGAHDKEYEEYLDSLSEEERKQIEHDEELDSAIDAENLNSQDNAEKETARERQHRKREEARERRRQRLNR